MLKKSCAIILSISLAMGILVHGSFAYDVPQDSVVSIGDLLEQYDSIYADYSINFALSYMESYLESAPYCGCRVYLGENGITDFFFFFSTVPFFVDSGYYFLTTSTGRFNTVKFRSNSETVFRTTDILPQQQISPNGGYWCSPSLDLNSSSELYFSIDTTVERTSYSANLNTSLDPTPVDTRVMEVYKSTQFFDYTPYLAVRVDDLPYAYMWISVRYFDALGPGTEIFDIYDLEYYPGDDFQLYLINPNLITTEEFTVTSVVFSGSLDWGYKEVDDLNITFNEPVYPDPIPSVTPVPDYNFFDTEIINYNGGQKDIFYNSFQVNIMRFEDSVPSYFFVDDYGYLNQPFSFNFILLPYYPVQQGFLYDDFIDDCFYQYDVILSEYYDAYFDFFYGSGALISLQSALSSYSAGSDISAVLESWYSSHSPVVYTYPYFDDSDLFHLSSDMPALLVVTDSFYFKQTNYLLGDTGNILSQFSERFYKVNGFADTLFGNLLSSYNLDLSFYEDTSRALTGLSYWLNDNDLDNLSYLVNIDNVLHELLEWFQNQEDPDVVLALPYFNPSLLEELYGLNIGELIQFFNGFVQTLPSFDYSDFPNFFTYANGVVDDIAGSNNSVIDDILVPYDFDDSGLSTFGWD